MPSSSKAASVEAVLFDIGDTLVRAAPGGTSTADLVAEPLPGAREVLHALRGSVRLGAVTDTDVMTAEKVRALLDPVGMSGPLEIVVTSVEIGARKPDPAGIIYALAYLGVSAERAVFVGDSQVDADAAAAAGVRFIGVGPLGNSSNIRAAISSELPQLRTALGGRHARRSRRAQQLPRP